MHNYVYIYIRIHIHIYIYICRHNVWDFKLENTTLQLCCSCVAACCSVLQRVAVSVQTCDVVFHSKKYHVVSVLQCVTACCNVLQCAAAPVQMNCVGIYSKERNIRVCHGSGMGFGREVGGGELQLLCI